MNILVNASNIKKSGALQVTLSFIREIKSNSHDTIIVVASSVVIAQVCTKNYPNNFCFVEVNLALPFTKLRSRFLNKMNNLVANHNIDCVFSIFGPSYWRPNVVHLLGFAHGWAVNPDAHVVKTLSGVKKYKHLLESRFKRLYFSSDADFYVVETDETKRRLSKYFKFSPAKIFVVANTANHHFLNRLGISDNAILLPPKSNQIFRLVTISSNFSHKNLSIIKPVLESLGKFGVNSVQFVVTIDPEEYFRIFGDTNDKIINIGTIKPEQCPSVYEQCDALFLPTLLECFSASYPEAMVMQKPILTSDLDFAKDICRDAALFFDPLNSEDIAIKIIELKGDLELQSKLISNGNKRFSEFPTARQRAEQYLNICKSIVRNASK